MNSNKKLLFPGWMSQVKNYQFGDGVEIWKERINVDAHFEAEYLVGHSLGANFVLLNWRANKNAKIILVCPLIFKKSIFSWFFCWLYYVISEGLVIPISDFKSNKLFFGLNKGLKLIRNDFSKIILEIPKENLLVIRGKNDNYFCDKTAAEFLKKENIRLIEIENCGHNWNEKMKESVLSEIK